MKNFPQIEMPEIQDKVDWDKLFNRIIGFDEFIKKWRDYHTNKNGEI